jgi:hypothetical protein
MSRVSDFGITHAAAFPPNTEGGQLFAEMTVVVQDMATQAAAQAASLSAALENTANKSGAHAALRAKLKRINRTAYSMAVDEPGIKSKFRMPTGSGDQVLVNAARGYVTNATPMKAAFLKKEMPADFLTALEANIAELEEEMNDKRRNTEAHVTAKAAIKTGRAHGLKLLRKLDPIVRNKFHDDPVTLAAWDSASRPPHRQRKPKPEPPPAPPK